jgi:DNA invertase Pin-like site-specific DNA recombinase
MVTERRVLRTTSLAYTFHLAGEPALEYETQRQSIERWASISRTRIVEWYEDKSSRRDRLRALLGAIDEIDYVLVHSVGQLLDARKFQQQCEARGARVVYTSR